MIGKTQEQPPLSKKLSESQAQSYFSPPPLLQSISYALGSWEEESRPGEGPDVQFPSLHPDSIHSICGWESRLTLRQHGVSREAFRVSLQCGSGFSSGFLTWELTGSSFSLFSPALSSGLSQASGDVIVCLFCVSSFPENCCETKCGVGDVYLQHWQGLLMSL